MLKLNPNPHGTRMQMWTFYLCAVHHENIKKKTQSASVGKKFAQHASRTQNDIYIHSVTRIRAKKPQHAE